jgi:hypothetical protein
MSNVLVHVSFESADAMGKPFIEFEAASEIAIQNSLYLARDVDFVTFYLTDGSQLLIYRLGIKYIRITPAAKECVPQ